MKALSNFSILVCLVSFMFYIPLNSLGHSWVKLNLKNWNSLGLNTRPVLQAQRRGGFYYSCGKYHALVFWPLYLGYTFFLALVFFFPSTLGDNQFLKITWVL